MEDGIILELPVIKRTWGKNIRKEGTYLKKKYNRWRESE